MRAFTSLLFVLLANFTFSQDQRPNVLLIITDDQGYGDLGFTGNPNIQTPTLDHLATESIRLTNFYVSPVCAPTRSSLMTGRYSLRTGVRDTYNGGAIMATSEITIAEMLTDAGYATGMFGKWHLGDSYPSRPMDQGFDESVIHLSGGMGQVGDFTTYFQGSRSYFDPVLWHNGNQEQYEGYCSDIFTTEAIQFIKDNGDNPFFCYLSFNAPHTPLQVPDHYYEMYKDLDPSAGFPPGTDLPEMTEQDKEDARKVYAMVTNIDDNIKRVLEQLEEQEILDNTIVIFMTDNGPQQRRYKGGLRGYKGNVYRGGINVPFYLRYPQLGANMALDPNAAHIDILPTLAELCGAEIPGDRKIDGISLLPILEGKDDIRTERPIFFNWTRRYPEKYRNIALQRGEYKLVAQTDYDAEISDFELYNTSLDPGEHNNIIDGNESLALELKYDLDSIYADLIASPNLTDPPGIIIGSQFENPVYLNRNDAGGERGIWAQEDIFGKWWATIHEGLYNITCKFIKPVEPNGRMVLETGAVINQKQIKGDGEIDILEMKGIHFEEMDCDVIPFYSVNNRRIFPFWVRFERVD
jgi:arylsulfatase